VKQFQVFQERSFHTIPLDEESLPLADVIEDCAYDRLFGIANCVVDVDQRVPVLVPVNRFRVLVVNTSDEVDQPVVQSILVNKYIKNNNKSIDYSDASATNKNKITSQKTNFMATIFTDFNFYDMTLSEVLL